MITEERAWKRGQKQTYTDRPLTDEEREFAGTWENYKKLFEFMHYYKMDENEWYDILIIPYLQAVKKYHVREDLRAKYKFWHVCNLMLSKAVYNHNRAMNRQKRKPEGGILSLDYMMEGENQFSEYRIEPWWIDPMKNVERYVIEKEFLNDIYSNLHRYAESDLLKLIINMRQEGWSDYHIAKKAMGTLSDYDGWSVKEIEKLIRVITCGYRSQLQRLYRDTMEYGNYEKFWEWKDKFEF